MKMSIDLVLFYAVIVIAVIIMFILLGHEG